MIALPLLLLASAVAVGSNVSRDGGDKISGDSTAPTAGHAQRSGAGAAPAPGVFVPRAKISADKPVSVPTDI